MKRIITAIILIAIILSVTACEHRQSVVVSHNVSKEADNFNIIRRITVINMRTDSPLFELIGVFSISNNYHDELEIICQTGQNEYKKHFIYLNDLTMYVVEDISRADVSPFHYEINFLPEMIKPIAITNSY